MALRDEKVKRSGYLCECYVLDHSIRSLTLLYLLNVKRFLKQPICLNIFFSFSVFFVLFYIVLYNAAKGANLLVIYAYQLLISIFYQCGSFTRTISAFFLIYRTLMRY